jgi:hypothetical protein
VTIDSAGEVGIGTTTPLSLLHLESTAPVIRFRDTAAAASTHSTISADNADGTITINADAGNNTTTTNSKIQFAVDASTHVTIKNDGNVGIGETDPASALTIKRTGNVEILLDPNQGSAAYSIITGTTLGGITLDADPSNNSATPTSIILKTDGTDRLLIRNTADSQVNIPATQTLHVQGILRPTLGNITLNTIAHNALADINTAGGALLGRTSTGAVTQIAQISAKSWLAYGSMADETKTNYLSTLSQVGAFSFGYAETTGVTISDITSSFQLVSLGSGRYYIRPKTAVGGTWTIMAIGVGTGAASIGVVTLVTPSSGGPIVEDNSAANFFAIRTA